MTYLNLVNAVLRKLREDEVSTVSETDYSRLVGDFVNDALATVEASWDWSCLRSTFMLTTAVDQSTYSLTDFGQRSEVMSIYNTSNGAELTRRHKEYIIQKQYQSTANGKPSYYSLTGTDSNGDIKIQLHPRPDAIQSYAVNAVVRDGYLSEDADNTLLPHQPIIQLAFAYALRERGETGGQSAMEQEMIAKQDLSNAIALDGANQADELVFGVI